MFLHHDLTWWAFVLSVVALVGTYPLSLLANLTSPAIKNWWAERSAASTRKRIEKLEKELRECETYPLLGELEDAALKAIEAIGLLAAICLYFLAAILVANPPMIRTTGSALIIGPPTTISRTMINSLATFGIATSFGFAILFRKFGRMREKRSPASRNALHESIDKLKAKLLVG
jgi:hypothetical protein